MPPPPKRSTIIPFGLFLVASLIGPPSAHAPEPPPLQALAPFDVFVYGLQAPRYLAVDSQDRVLVSEAIPGRILRIALDRTITALADQIRDPAGIAVDPTGVLFIASEGLRARERQGPPGVILRWVP